MTFTDIHLQDYLAGRLDADRANKLEEAIADDRTTLAAVQANPGDVAGQLARSEQTLGRSLPNQTGG